MASTFHIDSGAAEFVAPAQVLPFRAHHLSNGEMLMSHSYALYIWPLSGEQEPRLAVRYNGSGALRRQVEALPLVERFLRGGVHLARRTKSGSIVAFIKGTVLHAAQGDGELSAVFRIPGGARPLNVVETPEGMLFFGQYGNNPARQEISLFASTDGGAHWDAAYTFSPGTVRHIHGVLYDPYRHGLLVLTGDLDGECGVYLTTDGFRNLEPLLRGTQKARAVSVIPIPQGWVIPGDTPLERNYITLLEVDGTLRPLAEIPGSSFSTCRTRNGLFVSTGVEPSTINREPYATIWASKDGLSWKCVHRAMKDRYAGRFFQYANLLFADGLEESDRLYATGVSLRGLHHRTLAWDALP
jgi:hypothetical protein